MAKEIHYFDTDHYKTYDEAQAAGDQYVIVLPDDDPSVDFASGKGMASLIIDTLHRGLAMADQHHRLAAVLIDGKVILAKWGF